MGCNKQRFSLNLWLQKLNRKYSYIYETAIATSNSRSMVCLTQRGQGRTWVEFTLLRSWERQLTPAVPTLRLKYVLLNSKGNFGKCWKWTNIPTRSRGITSDNTVTQKPEKPPTTKYSTGSCRWKMYIYVTSRHSALLRITSYPSFFRKSARSGGSSPKKLKKTKTEPMLNILQITYKIARSLCLVANQE